MKKLLIVTLTVMMLFSLVSCNPFYKYKDNNYVSEIYKEPTEANCDEGCHLWENLTSYFSPDSNKKFICSICKEELDYSSFTDEDYISLIKRSYTDGIAKSLCTFDGNMYSRVISSSESREDAVKVCKKYYEGYRGYIVSCEVIYENELFYGIKIKRNTENVYESNVISFKKDVADIIIDNPNVGDRNILTIKTNDNEDILKIALYLFQAKFYHLDAIFDYEFSSDEDNYYVDVYTLLTVYGDWGIDDEYNFEKRTVVIDKNTRQVNFKPAETIKVIYIKGKDLVLV